MVLFLRELSRGALQLKPYGIKVSEIRAFASEQASEKLSYEGGEY
jgi:hypothetical protein